MAKRLGLTELTDLTPTLDRLYEADCPPKGTSVQAPIACRKIDVISESNAAATLLVGPKFIDAALVVRGDEVGETDQSHFSWISVDTETRHVICSE